MLTLFFLLAGLLAVQSLIALQDGPRFLAFVRRRLGQPLADYAPPATVICHCKGLDADLDANLRALLVQDYPDYEVVFVMAAADDPARAVCQRLARESRVPARVVIAGSPIGRGEKVNNLLAGGGGGPPGRPHLLFSPAPRP